jgi:hypothetical protein
LGLWTTQILEYISNNYPGKTRGYWNDSDNCRDLIQIPDTREVQTGASGFDLRTIIEKYYKMGIRLFVVLFLVLLELEMWVKG